MNMFLPSFLHNAARILKD